MTLFAITLRGVAVIPPLTQVASVKIPLIEILVRVTNLKKKIFLLLGTRVRHCD